MTLGLGHTRALLERLGHPERAFRTAVVAGTNGKGSVTAMLASILAAQGLRVGRFISPHVYSATERICVDDQPVTLDELERAAARVAPLHADIPFSYFEALTVLAFLVFAERGVEVAVLETGLGGRFDATNVTTPAVTVLTNVSLDHRRVLGDSEVEILREKLGIVRAGVPLLCGPFAPALRGVVEERARRDGFPLLWPEAMGEARAVGDDPGARVRLRTAAADYGEVVVPFPGRHQRANALLAVAAAERVAGPLTGVGEGLAAAYLPGRFERVERGGRCFVLDVAHNDEALAATALHLAEISPRAQTAVVMGLMTRKELFGAACHLARAAARVYLVTPDPAPGHTDGAYAPHRLLSSWFWSAGVPTELVLWNKRDADDDHWRRLLAAIDHDANPCRTVLVTGSHRVVEQFGRLLWPAEVLA
jgi:dihydrofolate synthase/folylpolyglutamate synthase